MKQVADTIRELMEDDDFIRRHEREIIQYYAGRALRIKEGPQAVRKDDTVIESRIA